MVVELEAREAPVRYGVGFLDPVSMLSFFKLLLLKGSSVLRLPPFGGYWIPMVAPLSVSKMRCGYGIKSLICATLLVVVVVTVPRPEVCSLL